MPTCSRQTLVKDHAFLVKPAYYLKSLYGVRGFCVCDISVVQEICTLFKILIPDEELLILKGELQLYRNHYLMLKLRPIL